MTRIDYAASLQQWHELQSEVDEFRSERVAYATLPFRHLPENLQDRSRALDELLPAMQWYADLWKAGLLRKLLPDTDGVVCTTTATGSKWTYVNGAVMP